MFLSLAILNGLFVPCSFTRSSACCFMLSFNPKSSLISIFLRSEFFLSYFSR
ncbi:unknown [Bacillus thuringiensis phage MZTP02]|uniref:Uncharacterized protein n=1 Tax=Bacillus thuringiensis phage MZTP02 TaxID=311221 RepID=Q56AS3_9CAUD|nr:unknown [Bacillus thuringiensis phage MZTP02]